MIGNLDDPSYPQSDTPTCEGTTCTLCAGQTVYYDLRLSELCTTDVSVQGDDDFEGTAVGPVVSGTCNADGTLDGYDFGSQTEVTGITSIECTDLQRLDEQY